MAIRFGILIKAMGIPRVKNHGDKAMSNVFDKAVKIAQARAAWEQKVNPEGEAVVFKRLSEVELNESQKLIDEFKLEVTKAAKKASFATVQEAKAGLDTLDYEKEYLPLWRMSELCIPVEPETETLARAIAPVRVGVIERIRLGKFGVYESVEDDEPSVDRTVVHHAQHREIESQPTRGDAAREMQAKRAAVQTEAFKNLSGALGGAMKAAKGAKPASPSAPKDLESVVKSLDKKLSGVRVVDGEIRKVAAVGQMKLFDEETAPVPKVAKVEKKAKPRMGK
jgi:hypothetical protein